jgi:hypothetical protein
MGDPKEFRTHAERCLNLAAETSDFALAQSLTECARRWELLAMNLDATSKEEAPAKV